MAWNRLVDVHRRHISAQNRSVTREAGDIPLTDRSAIQLATCLFSRSASPSAQVSRYELHVRVQAALDELPPRDREVLVMRYLERLSIGEVAASLGLTERGVKSRQRRALERLRDLLGEIIEEFDT